jgi:hypothetical protein
MAPSDGGEQRGAEVSRLFKGLLVRTHSGVGRVGASVCSAVAGAGWWPGQTVKAVAYFLGLLFFLFPRLLRRLLFGVSTVRPTSIGRRERRVSKRKRLASGSTSHRWNGAQSGLFSLASGGLVSVILSLFR